MRGWNALIQSALASKRKGSKMTIPTYFSHSYRFEDQNRNQQFWKSFSKADFSFFVDPPSDTTIHAHLERMMNCCSAFVAVVNSRRGTAHFCSPFVLYEYGLSIQARRPRLMLVDPDIGTELFEHLPQHEIHYFSDPPDELNSKIERLRKVALNFPNRLGRPRCPIAVLVPKGGSPCAYAQPKVRKRIEQAAHLSGFHVEFVQIPYVHNAFFALDLERYEAVILDVRGVDLPEWAFAYVYGRLAPTIKLAHLQPGEFAWSVQLPPLVAGLRMDEREPAVESITYWRDPDDLVFQLAEAFRKLDEEQAEFKKGPQGELYFESIGRRQANVFISNAKNANPLARRLAAELRLRNITQFQYKESGAIPVGSDWQEKILVELGSCDLFIGLIGKGYNESEWSIVELKAALKRHHDAGLPVFPYQLDGADVKVLGKLQAPELPSDTDEAVGQVLKDVQDHLVRPLYNQRRRPVALLGGSREAVVDRIRHVRKQAWPRLLSQMADAGVDLPPTSEIGVAPRPRKFAEQVFARLQRADAEPDRDVGAQVTFIHALAGGASGLEKKVLYGIAERIEEGRVNVQ